MVKALRKKRLFDEEADWVPGKGRSFTMKEKTQEAEDTQPTVVPTSLAPASDASKSQGSEDQRDRDLSFALKGPALSDAQARHPEAPTPTETPSS